MAKRQQTTPVIEETVEETPVEKVQTIFMMAGNEALFEETLNKAYDTVSYIWIRYHKQADEDTDAKEEITDRYVLPMTKAYDSHKRRYFRSECMHARMKKDVQARIEKDEHIAPAKCYSHKMTTDRCFRLDRIEMFETTLRPFTDRNRHYLELLTTYPQLRTRLGLKAVWIEVANENTGELQHVQVLVAAQ